MTRYQPLQQQGEDEVARMLATNPVRVECARLGISLTKLAKVSGVSRDTLNDIVLGNSIGTMLTFERLSPWLRVAPMELRTRMESWRARFPSLDLMTQKAKATLGLDPTEVPERFASFTEWEAQVAGSSRRLALLLHCSPSQLTKYKIGDGGSFPAAVMTGLLNDLKLTPEYIGELAALPRVGRVAPALRQAAAAGSPFSEVFDD